MADERTLVLVEDIVFTDRLETEARKLGGGLTEKMVTEDTRRPYRRPFSPGFSLLLMRSGRTPREYAGRSKSPR